MKPSQQFAWDSEEKCFYYINNEKKVYTKLSEDEHKEVYQFLMHVYSTDWSVMKKFISDYSFVKTMKEINDY